MSGHSKWSTIKRKKEKTDNARAKVFTKIGRELAVAIREGGPDPDNNSKLKDVIAKAKAANIPNDNIERAIKKGTGELESAALVDAQYEGIKGGTAVVVNVLTDNKNRTAGDVRHYFDKYGGNLGQSGCVSFMFERCGVILIDREDEDENVVDEDTLMEAALEAGAEDFLTDDDTVFEIRTAIPDLGAVRDSLEAAGYKFSTAEIQYVPSTYVKLTDEDALKNMAKMIEMFEDNDDVQNVWHNWENPEDAEDLI